MSMNADTRAPIAVSPDGLKKILALTDVKAAQDVLDQVRSFIRYEFIS
jgi:hypothetical protein